MQAVENGGQVALNGWQGRRLVCSCVYANHQREGVVPDDHRTLLYRPVESLGDAIRTDDLETAKRYRDQLNVFFVAPYATTGEPLGDAVAELYKVSGWWLRNFHARPEHKQQALLSVERVIGLLDA